MSALGQLRSCIYSISCCRQQWQLPECRHLDHHILVLQACADATAIAVLSTRCCYCSGLNTKQATDMQLKLAALFEVSVWVMLNLNYIRIWQRRKHAVHTVEI